MSHQPTTFPRFLSLPSELRSRVWELSLSPPVNTSNIIHVHFTQQAYLQLPTKKNTRTPKLRYRFKCFSPSGLHGPPVPDTRSRHAYAEYLGRNPHELRLNQGQRIRFNALKHTIFMDRASLYALGQYLLYREPNVIHRNLKGFNDIQTLGTPLAHCNREGFVSKKAYGLTRHALGGVVRFVTVGNIPGVPDEGVARSELIHELDKQLQDLLAVRAWSQEIVNEVLEAKDQIPQRVDMFFGAPDLENRLNEMQEMEEGEEALDEARILRGIEQDGDSREQCMDPDCGFCKMQTWEERRRHSVAGKRRRTLPRRIL